MARYELREYSDGDPGPRTDSTHLRLDQARENKPCYLANEELHNLVRASALHAIQPKLSCQICWLRKDLLQGPGLKLMSI